MAVRHYIFLIHGTWGKDGAGWYQPSAARENFAKRLAARLTGTPLEGAVWNEAQVFEWSGENTHWARIKAAIDLGDMLLRIRFAQPSERPRFHFIAHSHGGNVLLAALVRYVTQLPVALVHAMKFPYFVSTDEQASEFFAAVRRLVLQTGFHPDHEVIRQDPQLQTDVRNFLADVERRYRLFTSGRLGVGEQWGLSGMISKVALFLLRMSTFREEHGIASTVFLGTPFYYKQWRADGRRRALDRIANALGEASMTGLAAYIAMLMGTGVTSWLSWTSWVGLSPLHWPLWAHIGLGAAVAYGALDGARRVPGIANTNMYFDETLFLAEAGSSPLTNLGGRTLFDALVIKSGYVDEAFSGLSSFPVIGAVAPRLVDGFLKPRPWVFMPIQREIGRYRATVGERARRWARGGLRRLTALALFAAYPLRRAFYALVTRPTVMNQTARVALPLSLGLPGDEFLAGSVVVKQDLDVPQVSATHRDVARELLTVPPDLHVDQARFEFLWNDAALEERYAHSAVAKQFPEAPPVEVKRHVLAIEERLREFFGVAGLRHSLYYDNDIVLEAISTYLLRDAAPASPGAESTRAGL